MEEEKEEISFERIMGNDYMTIKGKHGEEQRNYQIRMITENRMKYFLDCSVKLIDNGLEYRYRISSMYSLKQVMEKRRFREQDIIQLIEGLIKAAEGLEEYLLSEDKILLDPCFIYVDTINENNKYGISAERDLYFCYYPEKEQSFTQSVKAFFPYILKKTDHEDKDAIILAYSLYQISLEDRITIDELKKTLHMPLLAGTKPEENKEQNEVHNVDNEKDIMEGEKKEPVYVDREKTEKKTEQQNQDWTKNTLEIMENASSKSANKIGNETKKQKDRNEKKDRKKSIKEIMVPFLSAIIVFGWFGYHYMRGEFPWMEDPELYTGIILLIIASNMVYVFGNAFQAVEEERKKKKHTERAKKNRGDAGHMKDKKENQMNGATERKQHKYALLSCQPEKIPNIPVNHFPFVIGRKAEESDFQIMDQSIKNKHAGLEREQGDVYIIDYSCGATYIDGYALKEEESMPILPGQEIRFSDFSFIWADQKI